MRKQISSPLLIGVALLFLCGCHQAFKAENYTSLTPGMSKAQVQEKMGKPMGTGMRDGMEVWEYDQHDPITSRMERIELRFQNGVYKDMTKSSSDK